MTKSKREGSRLDCINGSRFKVRVSVSEVRCLMFQNHKELKW